MEISIVKDEEDNDFKSPLLKLETNNSYNLSSGKKTNESYRTVPFVKKLNGEDTSSSENKSKNHANSQV